MKKSQRSLLRRCNILRIASKQSQQKAGMNIPAFFMRKNMSLFYFPYAN